jgi:FkbM family methyltransferase
MQVIYDFGSNNGDDVPYYLKKADLVVAVEANPALARAIRDRFPDEVAQGTLVVINCVLTTDASSALVPFYVHKTEHFLSQFPQPPQSEAHQFERILVESRKASDIIRTYGQPHYVKVDLEQYDQFVLEEVLSEGIRPEFISAESHSVEIFALLVAKGGYRSFKLVDGKTVALTYSNHTITTRDGAQQYAFPYHSAGPFGTDIPGSWLTANNFFYLLAYERLGWKDIHATNCVEPDPQCKPIPRMGLRDCLKLLPSAVMRTARNRLYKVFA